MVQTSTTVAARAARIIARVATGLLLATVACRTPAARLTFASPRSEPLPELLWDAPDDPYLTELRVSWNLERLRGATDLDTVRAVSAWVSGLWRHHGRNTPKRSDPLSILEEVKAGKRFRCVEYAIVVKGCLSALGVPARLVGLMTQDVETRWFGAGHVVAEAYLRERKGWVMVDGQWNAIPFEGSTPLSAVALQASLARGSRDLRYEGLARARWNEYGRWVAPYLFYFQAPIDNRTYAPSRQYRPMLLVPAGADAPRRFERRVPIDTITVRSIETFYPVVTASTATRAP